MKHITLKADYPFNCWACGYGQRAKPSMFMQTGIMNQGAGNCINCGKHNMLEIDLETNDKMIASKETRKETNLEK